LEPRSDHTKECKLIFVASVVSTQYYWVRVKRWWIRIRIMGSNEVTCLPIEFYFRLAVLKSISLCLFSIKRTASLSHQIVTCSCHDMAEKLLTMK